MLAWQMWFRLLHWKQALADGQKRRTIARAQEAEVADTNKAFGQDMK
jgi:hypothetical protein